MTLGRLGSRAARSGVKIPHRLYPDVFVEGFAVTNRIECQPEEPARNCCWALREIYFA